MALFFFGQRKALFISHIAWLFPVGLQTTKSSAWRRKRKSERKKMKEERKKESKFWSEKELRNRGCLSVLAVSLVPWFPSSSLSLLAFSNNPYYFILFLLFLSIPLSSPHKICQSHFVFWYKTRSLNPPFRDFCFYLPNGFHQQFLGHSWLHLRTSSRPLGGVFPIRLLET